MDPSIEANLRRDFPQIAGVDEVGRGPWAGPVTAAAVVLDRRALPKGLTDSKKLSAKARDRLAAEIQATAHVSIAHADVAEIDEINILQASMLAMRRAVSALPFAPDLALVDGRNVPNGLPCPGQALVKGDALAESVAAASIVAKVARDKIMVALAQQYPGYGWETNAGYGTIAHRDGLAKLGVTPHHRRSFKPIHNILCAQKLPNS